MCPDEVYRDKDRGTQGDFQGGFEGPDGDDVFDSQESSVTSERCGYTRDYDAYPCAGNAVHAETAHALLDPHGRDDCANDVGNCLGSSCCYSAPFISEE